MLGDDVNVKVDFLARFVTGKEALQPTNMLEKFLSHSLVKQPVQKHLTKTLKDPMLDYFTRLSSACARTAVGVSMHATQKVEKKTLEVLEGGDRGKKCKVIKTDSVFGPVPLLVKTDSKHTVRKIKDIAFANGAPIFPRVLTGYKHPSTFGVDFFLCIKVMIYGVLFFAHTCGFQAFRLASPLSDAQHHLLFKVTPDGTRWTKGSKSTKFQISQLVISALRRCHA